MAVTLRAAGTGVSGTTSLVMSSPGTAVAGDLLLAFTIDHATSGSTTAPTGWVRLGGIAGTAGRFQVFSAVVGRGGLTGTSWTWSSLTTRARGQILAWFGQWGANLDGAISVRLNASGTTGTTAVTTLRPGDLLVGGFAALASGSTWSAETTATAGALAEISDSANSTFCSLATASAHSGSRRIHRGKFGDDGHGGYERGHSAGCLPGLGSCH